MITVAALLPKHWEVRLINRNTELLTEENFAWADMVMAGGMLPQRNDALHIIDMCRANGKPVVIGGPDVTSSPDVYSAANFQVLGEAEEIMADFIAAWQRGEQRVFSRLPWARPMLP